jgi:rubrerythrin
MSNWIDFAIRTEEKGLAFYRQCLVSADNDDIKELFLFLVAEEENHKKALEELKGNIKTGFVDSENRMFDDSEIKKVQADINSISSMLNKAMKFEEDGIAVYSEFLEEQKDEGTTRFLQRLVDDEIKHRETIKKFGLKILGMRL